jgi:MFS family permease
MNLRYGLRAFRHRDFRVYFAGQGTSQIGTWLQLIATSWLVHSLTGSAFMLGLAAFAIQVPFLVLAPFAGVLVDQFERRRVLLVTNTISMLQSLVLLAFVATGRIDAWILIAGNLVLGLANAFDAPARQSMLVDLVRGRADLPSAIALQSTMMNGGRFLGPMLGGAVIAAFGFAWGFALNSLSYCAILWALARIRPPARSAPPRGTRVLQRLREGVAWTFGFLPSRSVLLLLAATSFCIQPYQSQMPWFADKVFGGDSRTLGWLLGAIGLGAVSGMLYLAQRPTVRGLFRLAGMCCAGAGLALIGFSLAGRLWIALPLLYFTGMGMMLVAASTNTLLQTIVPDELRGRVASLYIVAFIGISPLGALAAGWLGERIGPPFALALFGAGALAAAALYATRLPAIQRDIVPVYERLGISR